MIVWGVKQLIILSWGGALQKELNTGDIVVNHKALRDEGVSQHYLPSEKYVSADLSLKANLERQITARGSKFTSGSTWTTDAPYRETKDEVLRYQSEGIQVVEMEIAGLFALAQLRKVQAVSVVVVADKLADLSWELPVDMKAIDRSFEIAYNAAIDTLDEAQ
jgi:uridine phosphorylase